jgi:hypothetical protein
VPQLETLSIESGAGVGKLTSDDDILEPTGDSAVSFCVERSFIAGFEPSDTLCIGDKCISGFLGVVPVSLGELIASHAQLPTLAYWNDVSLGVNYFRTGVRQHLSDRG